MSAPTREQVYAEANRLARDGISVIPIGGRTKQPPPGFEWGSYADEHADASERYTWFIEQGHQLGVVAGPISGNLTPLDYDGDGGYESHAERYPVLRTYPRVRTGSGKVHVYVRTAAPVKKYVTTAPDGSRLEVRAGTHITVCPPSLHPSGNCYAWEAEPWGGIPIIALEDIGLVGEPAEPERTADPISEGTALTDEQRTILVEALAPSWTPGRRHDLTYAAAGYFANSGVPEADAGAVLLAVARQAGLADEKLGKTKATVRRTYANGRAGTALAGWKLLTHPAGPLVPRETADRMSTVMRQREPVLVLETELRDMPPGACEIKLAAALRRVAVLETELTEALHSAETNARALEEARRVNEGILAVLRSPGAKTLAPTLIPLLVEYFAAPALDDLRARVEHERARRADGGPSIDDTPLPSVSPYGRRRDDGYYQAYLGNPSQADRERAKEDRERARAALAEGLDYTPTPIRPKGLAARIGTKPGTISAHLDVAHELGLIDKRPEYAPNLNAGDGGKALLLKPAADDLPAMLTKLAAVSEDEADQAAARVRTPKKPKPAVVAVPPPEPTPAVVCPDCGSEHVQVVCLDCDSGAEAVPYTVLRGVVGNVEGHERETAGEHPYTVLRGMEPLAAVERMQRNQKLRRIPTAATHDPAAAAAARIRELANTVVIVAPATDAPPEPPWLAAELDTFFDHTPGHVAAGGD